MISKGKMQSARGKMNVREQERPHHHFEFCNLHFSLSNKYLHFVRNFPEQSQDRLGLVRCQAAHATGRRDETLPEDGFAVQAFLLQPINALMEPCDKHIRGLISRVGTCGDNTPCERTSPVNEFPDIAGIE